jgi:hypothetical protein
MSCAEGSLAATAFKTRRKCHRGHGQNAHPIYVPTGRTRETASSLHSFAGYPPILGRKFPACDEPRLMDGMNQSLEQGRLAW